MKDLNLIPKKVLLNQKEKKRKFLIIMIVSLSLFIFSISIIIPLYIKTNLENKKSILNIEISNTYKYYELEKKFTSIKNIYKILEKNGDSYKNYGIGLVVLDILEKIRLTIPDGVLITQLTINKDQNNAIIAIISAEAESEIDIAAAIYNIKKIKYFNEISLLTANEQRNDGSYSFSIKLLLNIGK